MSEGIVKCLEELVSLCGHRKSSRGTGENSENVVIVTVQTIGNTFAPEALDTAQRFL